MLGAAIANLYAQGAITPDTDTENWIRRVFDMPSTTATPQPKQRAAQQNGQGDSAQIAPTQQKGNVSQGNVGAPPSAAS
jgi:hypothetical protein